jgi:8-amino-7-oxononanoate synthase/acyl carrier protein
MKFHVSKLADLEKSPKTLESIFSVMFGNQTIACEYTENDRIVQWTYPEYRDKIIKAASALSGKTAGIPADSYIALKMANSPLWPVMFWAILMSGHKPLLIDAAQSVEMTDYLMKQAGAEFLLDTPVEFESENAASFVPSWSDEIALCTSGTTSTSKVFFYTGEALYYQLLNTRAFVRENDRITPEKEDRVLAFLPLHHIFGLMNYIWFSFYGISMVYIKDRAPETILDACRKHKVTQILTVPLLPNNIVKSILKRLEQAPLPQRTYVKGMMRLSLAIQTLFPRTGLSFAKLLFRKILSNLLGTQIKVIICGGSHTSPVTLRVMNALGYYTVCGFGMTEVGVTSCESSYGLGKRLNGSIGKPLPHVEYLSATEMSGGRTGALAIRGTCIHSGRLIGGEKKSAELDENGWFGSGDVVSRKRGSFRIEGRIKDVIINESGENVYPDELEDYFDAIPYQTQLSILGVRKDAAYEYIALVLSVQKKDMTAEKFEEIRKTVCAINSTLPVMKRVNRVYLTTEALPVANGIKVKRNKLKESVEQRKILVTDLNLKSSGCTEIPAAVEAATADNAAMKISDNEEFLRIKAEIRNAFSVVLDLPENSISDTAHFVDDLGGDSLSSISLLVKVEDKYGIVIPNSEYYSCTDVAGLSTLVYRKIHGISTAGEAAALKDSSPKKVVTCFEESREFAEFKIRQKGMDEIGNPYFIRHDSTIKDVSLWNGKKEVLNFGSYNYLGMSGHPETVAAAKKAADIYGTSASGSRILAGEKSLYQELERAIARWKHAEASIVMVSGHATNVSFVGNFCNEHDIILYDALSHNSIVQGCQLSKSDSKAFPHNDFKALDIILRNARDKYEKVLVVVEGVYSMDGDIAPMPEFIKLKEKYGFFLMVDEAHSACVIGDNGGGVDDYFHLKPTDIDIKMGTLSKGLGTCGGYLAGKKILIEYLKYSVPGFVFSVGINPSSAAAALAAVHLIEKNPEIVQRLHENIRTFLNTAHQKGFNTCLAGETAIIPILVGGDKDAFILSNMMLEKGVFVPPAVYPAVPKGQSRLRFCMTSEHKKEQILKALDLLEEAVRESGIPGVIAETSHVRGA